MKTIRASVRRSVHCFALGGFLLSAVSPLAAATLTVTSTNDSGPGTLRQAIADAAPGDTINFAVTGDIALTNGELVITNNLTIQGPGQANLAVDPGLTSRAFQITNATVMLSDFTIRNAKPPFGSYGGAILNHYSGVLTLSNLWISGTQPAAGGSGHAVENWGGLTIVQTVISNNFGAAAAIANYGNATLLLIASDVVSNAAPGNFVGAIVKLTGRGNNQADHGHTG